MPNLSRPIQASIIISIIGFLTVVTIVAGILGSSKLLLNESFESGVLNWQIGKDLPIDPNTQLPVDASVQITDTRSRTGENSLLIHIDGRQDDGTIWIARNMTLDRTDLGRIKISFYVFSEQASFNVKANVVAYIGSSPPLNESCFDILGNADKADGWTEFILEKKISFKNADCAWIALGITAAWETIMEYAIDDISVKLFYC